MPWFHPGFQWKMFWRLPCHWFLVRVEGQVLLLIIYAGAKNIAGFWLSVIVFLQAWEINGTDPYSNRGCPTGGAVEKD